MKICVINFSGNVGKSTLAKHLLIPRIDDCEFVSVESINADESEEEAIRGKRFGQLTEMLDLCDAAVVDVGSSNVEDFLTRMMDFRGSHEDFDYFVVPVTPPKKQQRDTLSTIAKLAEIGVEPERIRIIMNSLERDDDPTEVFSSLFAGIEAENLCAKPSALVRFNELFGLLRGSNRTIADLLADETDYRGKMRATEDKDEKLRMSRALAMRRLAAGVQEDLDAAWDVLWENAA